MAPIIIGLAFRQAITIQRPVLLTKIDSGLQTICCALSDALSVVDNLSFEFTAQTRSFTLNGTPEDGEDRQYYTNVTYECRYGVES